MAANKEACALEAGGGIVVRFDIVCVFFCVSFFGSFFGFFKFFLDP